MKLLITKLNISILFKFISRWLVVGVKSLNCPISKSWNRIFHRTANGNTSVIYPKPTPDDGQWSKLIVPVPATSSIMHPDFTRPLPGFSIATDWGGDKTKQLQPNQAPAQCDVSFTLCGLQQMKLFTVKLSYLEKFDFKNNNKIINIK